MYHLFIYLFFFSSWINLKHILQNYYFHANDTIEINKNPKWYLMNISNSFTITFSITGSIAVPRRGPFSSLPLFTRTGPLSITIMFWSILLAMSIFSIITSITITIFTTIISATTTVPAMSITGIIIALFSVWTFSIIPEIDKLFELMHNE